jgi:selenide,water dikinase
MMPPFGGWTTNVCWWPPPTSSPTPFLALNVACLPASLPPEIAADVFRGLADKVKEAGAVVAGGHSIQDDEPKVGLVALGFAEAGRLMTKGAAQPGQILVLTKPLGTGVTSTALKAGTAAEGDVERMTGWMSRLNRDAAVLGRHHGVRAATDVTGFGLMGHAAEMAQASGVALAFDLAAIPRLPNAAKYVESGHIPGGTFDNQRYFADRVSFEGDVITSDEMLLYDAQTSGGLLMAVPAGELDAFMGDAEKAGQPAWRIGEVLTGSGLRVRLGGVPVGAAIAAGGVDYLGG